MCLISIDYREFRIGAARIVLNARKYDHVSPLLKQLHWLPVSKRIMYKVALIVYKSIHSLTPQYISCLFSPVQLSRYSLRSRTDPSSFENPLHQFKRKGEQNISYVFLVLLFGIVSHWMFVHCPSVESFKRNLKTYLYSV